MADLSITSIFIYPIKSLGGISLTSSRIEFRGLQHDRRWMLVDENNQFITQRNFPKMALLQPTIEAGLMKVEDRSGKINPLVFPLAEPNSEIETVTVWDDECPAKSVGTMADLWFTKALEMPCRLMYMHDASVRQADQRYAINEEDKVSFADGYPILMICEESMELLNSKLEQPLSMARFRPNIVFKGGKPHQEDELRKLQINGVELFGVKPCARCVLTTIDPETTEKGKEPLKTLATYRKVGAKILFGENFIPMNEGEIKVDDHLEIKEEKSTKL